MTLSRQPQRDKLPAQPTRERRLSVLYPPLGAKTAGVLPAALAGEFYFPHIMCGLAHMKTNTPQDISTEISRTYRWPGGELVTIRNPVKLIVSNNGHRIADDSNNGHYIPNGWIHLSWINKPGVEPIVA